MGLQLEMAWWRWVKIWQSLRSIIWTESISSLFWSSSKNLLNIIHRSIVPSVVRMLLTRTSYRCTSKVYTITASPFCVTSHVTSLLQQSITLLRRTCLKNCQIECQFCGDKFGTLVGLKEHHKRGKCDKRYQCLECENQPYFSKSFDFKIHKEVTHTKGDPGQSDSPQQPFVIQYVP